MQFLKEIEVGIFCDKMEHVGFALASPLAVANGKMRTRALRFSAILPWAFFSPGIGTAVKRTNAKTKNQRK